MIAEIFAILTGLVLLTGVLGVIPVLGKYLERFAKWLGSFQGVLGIISIIIGLLYFFSLSGIMCIITGIMLAIGLIQTLPLVGDAMKRAVKFLGGFQVIIGIIAVIVGIAGLL